MFHQQSEVLLTTSSVQWSVTVSWLQVVSDGESYYSQSDLSSSYSSSRVSQSQLSPAEISLIKSSFSSLRSVCYVSNGLATLYTSSTSSLELNNVSRDQIVPVLLLNLGGSRAREARGVEMILADRRTGLAILRDRLDTLSSYRGEGKLHTWHCSKDHRLLLSLHWVSHHTAAQFLHLVQELMDHPENVGLSGPDKIKTDSKQKRKYKVKRRDKKDISSPCGFQHHVSLSVEEWTKMTAFQ